METIIGLVLVETTVGLTVVMPTIVTFVVVEKTVGLVVVVPTATLVGIGGISKVTLSTMRNSVDSS